MTIEERREWLKEHYRKRYRELIEMPFWKEDELAELGDGLREYVSSRAEARKLVLRRLEWPFILRNDT